MSIIKDGDTVKVHYTGKLQNGEVFDSSVEREPLEFTLGQGQLIPGFEKAIIGLKVGDSTTTNIPSAEAYGDHNPEMEVQVEKAQLPEGMEPQVGMQLQLNQPNGQAIPVQITKVEGEQVTIDANHPLAGKDLTFDIEVVEIA
ncbi:MAG TPA: peptidylprolyl isomerase [Balneolaceae bacterium]|nr:peptidylprolyl isomerase [Balneolaceae bacterium]